MKPRDGQESIYEFGEFRLNVGQLMLYRGDVEMQLRPKAVEILVALVERRGEIVSKDELMQTIWADAIVEESNLSRYIHILRSVLGTQSDGKPYIDTYRRRGFRFNSEVGVLCHSTATPIRPVPDPLHLPVIKESVREATTGNVIALARWQREHEEHASDKERQTTFASLEDPETEIPAEGEVTKFPGRSLRGKKFIVTAVVVAVAVALMLGVSFGLYRATRETTDNVNLQVQRLSGDGQTRFPKISPDGKFLAYVKFESGMQSLWIKQIATGSNVNVVKPGEALRFDGITFSPDGNFVFFNALMPAGERPTVYRVPSLGGTPVKFLSDGAFLQFSEDGRSIAFRRMDTPALSESILVANADGTNERVIATRAGKQFFTSANAWSPDGKLLAVGVGDDDLGATGSVSVVLISVETGEQKEFGERRWDNVSDVTWHPSGGSLIVVATENIYLAGQVWELSYPSGKYRRLTNTLNGHYGISITADGRSIVTGELSARSAVWVSPDLDPGNAKQVMPSTGDTWGFTWTADGRIVYISDQTGDAEVWIMNADGSEARQLTNDRIFKMNPCASPDGRYIVYTSSQNGGELVRLEPKAATTQVLTKAIGADNAHISPDSKWVLYSAFVDGVAKVLRVPLDGGEEQLIADRPGSEPRYSNDGTRFACFTMNDFTTQWTNLLIYSVDGDSPVATFDIPPETNWSRGPVWTPDDKGIVLINTRAEQQNLWLQPLDGTPGRLMTEVPTPGISRREYSRDGKRIAVVRTEGLGNAIMLTDFR